MALIHRILAAQTLAALTSCAVVDDLTTGNWTNWGCEEEAQDRFKYSEAQAKEYCNKSREEKQRSWAKANNLPETHSWSRDSLNKIGSTSSPTAASPSTTQESGQQAIHCIGKANCTFEMPMGKCGSYSERKVPYGYGLTIKNSCSYDVVYRLHIAKAPNYYPNSGDDFKAFLRPGETLNGFTTYEPGSRIRINANYSCRTTKDTERMLNIRLASCFPENNVTKRATCRCITAPNAGGVAK